MSRPLSYAVEVAAARGAGQDRARVYAQDDGLVIALADGAGGTAHGAAAAQAIVDAAHLAPDACELLSTLDRDPLRLSAGQSTAVLLALRGNELRGASVGDSGAWLVRGADIIDLTAHQHRKPLVGAGCLPTAIPTTQLDHATLLVASDGLWRYARAADLARIASGEDLAAAARALVDLVRLPSGQLQDDVAVVLCRR